jgi:hypothetical protein
LLLVIADLPGSANTHLPILALRALVATAHATSAG